ncbi:MAG: 4Fe-4S binding protein [Armatimonadetes bacterium]|jgi:NAD-dependent dihydropyrimidine dehydrogenase PreA subunit|nr:4Fe-4S binding protein [Armatimonadota bacterium]
MAKKVRQIIKIDEELCDGCGQCVTACAEGALQIIDGKARLVSETYCDGLGACIGDCPRGAITIESREADEFDEAAAMKHVAAQKQTAQAPAPAHSGGFVCPSMRMIDRTKDLIESQPAQKGSIPSELRQWPVKLYLVNPGASYFENSDLLLAADCVPFAYGGIHPDYMRGKTLVTGCPKFDDVSAYADKLEAILSSNTIRSLTVLQMEVPCCSGMLRLAQRAVAASGKSIPIEVITISLSGDIKTTQTVPA